MRLKAIVLGTILVVMPSMAMAQQAQPAQITNDDLLKLIGLQQVQNLQLGKTLEACQQQVKALTPEPEKSSTETEGKK